MLNQKQKWKKQWRHNDKTMPGTDRMASEWTEPSMQTKQKTDEKKKKITTTTAVSWTNENEAMGRAYPDITENHIANTDERFQAQHHKMYERLGKRQTRHDEHI